MTVSERERLAALATDYEQKAHAIRTTLALLTSLAQDGAAAALPKKLHAATVIRRAVGRPKTRQRNDFVGAVKNLLGTSTMPEAEFRSALKSLVGSHASARVFDLKKRGHIKITKRGVTFTAKDKALARAVASTNGHRKISSKGAHTAYLVELLNAKARPMTSAEIIASASEDGHTISGQAIGAATRHGTLIAHSKRKNHTRTFSAA